MTDGIHVDERLLGGYVTGLGAIGETPDGMYRFVYDDAWQRARDALLGWIDEAGLEGRVDAVGNVFGRLPGSGDGVVLTGSHVDTVRRHPHVPGGTGFRHTSSRSSR